MIFVQFTLFLLIGVLLFVYYQRLRTSPPPAQNDRIYPEFIWNNLPPGLAGLIIAAILAAAMANLSAALNSLASTTVVDFYRARAKIGQRAAALKHRPLGDRRLGRRAARHRHRGARHSKSVLEAGLTIASIPFGALLGVFLLGVLTRKTAAKAPPSRRQSRGSPPSSAIHFYTPIAWTWYVLIGTVMTFGVGLLASLFQGPRRCRSKPPASANPREGCPTCLPEHANPEE